MVTFTPPVSCLDMRPSPRPVAIRDPIAPFPFGSASRSTVFCFHVPWMRASCEVRGAHIAHGGAGRYVLCHSPLGSRVRLYSLVIAFTVKCQPFLRGAACSSLIKPERRFVRLLVVVRCGRGMSGFGPSFFKRRLTQPHSCSFEPPLALAAGAAAAADRS